MFNIKALALATAVSAGVVFAMPVATEAANSTVKIHVNNKDKSPSWWARHCRISNDVKCGHHVSRFDRHRHYYGHYRYRHHNKSGVYLKVD